MLEEARSYLAVIQTLTDDKSPNAFKPLLQLSREEDVKNKDWIAVNPILPLSIESVVNTLWEVDCAVHQMVPEKYQIMKTKQNWYGPTSCGYNLWNTIKAAVYWFKSFEANPAYCRSWPSQSCSSGSHLVRTTRSSECVLSEGSWSSDYVPARTACCRVKRYDCSSTCSTVGLCILS